MPDRGGSSSREAAAGAELVGFAEGGATESGE